MAAEIVVGVPGRGDVRVVLMVRPGVYHRGDLALVYPHGRTVRIELAPRLVRLLLALVLAYQSAPPPRPSSAEELFGGDVYRGQVHPAKVGQLYARVLPPCATIESKTVRTYVSELRQLVRSKLDADGSPALADPDVISGGDGYRIGPNGLEVLGYEPVPVPLG